MISVTDQRTDTRRSEDGSNGTPWWVALIYKYGIWAALACYLIYYLVNIQAATLTRIDTAVTANRIESTAAVSEQKERANRMETYLRLLCSFSAKSAVDRNTCLSVR